MRRNPRDRKNTVTSLYVFYPVVALTISLNCTALLYIHSFSHLTATAKNWYYRLVQLRALWPAAGESSTHQQMLRLNTLIIKTHIIQIHKMTSRLDALGLLHFQSSTGPQHFWFTSPIGPWHFKPKVAQCIYTNLYILPVYTDFVGSWDAMVLHRRSKYASFRFRGLWTEGPHAENGVMYSSVKYYCHGVRV